MPEPNNHDDESLCEWCFYKPPLTRQTCDTVVTEFKCPKCKTVGFILSNDTTTVSPPPELVRR